MDKFVTSIKKKYQERLIKHAEEWLPHHSDKLIRLELVEREKGKGYSANIQRGREFQGIAEREKREQGYSANTQRGINDKAVQRTPLAYGDLFKVESGKRPVRKILVEGDAGIGKTTLCIAVSEDWANGKLFQQFELVLLLPLRMKVVASAGSLPELLQLLHPSQRLCDLVTRYLEEEEGENVLIIADGWDELSDSIRQNDSFLYQLLFQIFPLLSVIVTSRPSASAPLHRFSCINRFVEVQGFSKENIKEYIESEFASDQRKAASLFEQLEQNPLVVSVCSVPLNCVIVCHLWRTFEETLPTTMTELYTKIILNVVLRNIQKMSAHENILSLSKFDALPADLQESWWLLCEFAYQTLKKDQLVFFQEELTDFFPRAQGLALNGKIFCFGLLQSANSIIDIGCGVSFHFLHLTFQEYLAALHLVKRLINKQSSKSNKLILDHKFFRLYSVQKRFSIVWRFLFGIYFNVIGCSDSTPMEPYLQYCRRDHLLLCHCAFEARNADVASFIADSLRNLISLYHSGPSTTHDCAAVLYVIDKMQQCPCICISFSNSHIGDDQIKALTNSLASKDGKLLIENLNLSGNELTYECLSDLLHRASCTFRCLSNLDIGALIIDPQKIMILLASRSCQRLSHLNLSGNKLGVSGLQALETQ